jgi:hypothetical protein
VEVDDGLVVPQPGGVDGEVVVVPRPDDGPGEAVRPPVPDQVDDVVARERGDELAEPAGPRGVVREHGQHDAAAEVLRRQPRGEEPVVERVEQVVAVPRRRDHEGRRGVPHVAPASGLLRPRRAERHLVDGLGGQGVPLARVRTYPLLPRGGVVGGFGWEEEEERERRGVRAHVAGHEADVGVVVGPVAADGVAPHRRARGPHLVVEDDLLADARAHEGRGAAVRGRQGEARGVEEHARDGDQRERHEGLDDKRAPARLGLHHGRDRNPVFHGDVEAGHLTTRRHAATRCVCLGSLCGWGGGGETKCVVDSSCS